MQISGILIATNGARVGGRQIVIWVSRDQASSSADLIDLSLFQPVAQAATDTDDGAFSFEFSDLDNANIVTARATIVGEDIPPSSILVEDGKIKSSFLLLTEELLDDISDTSEGSHSNSGGDCVFELRSYEAVQQQKFLHLARIGNFEGQPPKVKSFNIVDAPALTEDQIKGFQDALGGQADKYKIATDTSFPLNTILAPAPADAKMPAANVKSGGDSALAPDTAGESGATLSPGTIEFSQVAIGPAMSVSPTLQIAAPQIYDAQQSYFLAEMATDIATFTPQVPERYDLADGVPLDWDDTPSIVQACEPILYHALEYVQEVVHAGYQQGPIVGTETLQPCQERQIATVSFRRDETNRRSESRTSRDQLTNALARARDIEDLQSATVREASRGSSSANSWSVGVAAAIPLPAALIGVSGGFSRSTSTANQSSMRNMSARASQNLRDSTQQAAESIRSQTVTVVHAVTQEESVTATTEVIKNHNRTRSLNMVTSEIYAAFDARTRLTGVREAIAIPLRVSMFNHEKVLRWREPLQRVLPRRDLQPGFDAIERIQNGYSNSNIPAGRFADAPVRFIDGILSVEFRIRAPSTTVLPSPESGPFNFSSWASAHPFAPRILSRANYRHLVERWLNAEARASSYFHEKIAPRLASDLVQNIRVYAIDADNNPTLLSIDPTALTKLDSRGMMQVSFNLDEPLDDITRADIKFLRFELVDDNESAVPVDRLLPEGSKLIVHGGQFNYQTQFSSGTLFRNSRIRDDLSGTRGDDDDEVPDEADTVLVSTPLSAQELVSPVHRDIELRNHLLRELNTNVIWYHEAIYDYMAQFQPSKLRMLLDRIYVPGTSETLTVRDVIGEYIGAIDGCVTFFVGGGHGFTDDLIDVDASADNLVDYYTDESAINEPLRLTLPTGTTYTETYLGKCVLREKTDHALAVDWSEPCDSAPTPINPVSTDSRRSEPTDLTAQDFSQPIINLQNAPEAPGFGGTSDILNAISNPETFRNLTGLDANQSNAAAALRDALAGANSARQDALTLQLAKMAEKEQDLQNIDRVNARLEQYDNQYGSDDGFSKSVAQDAIRNAVRRNREHPPISSEEYRELDPYSRLQRDFAKIDALEKSLSRPGLADFSVEDLRSNAIKNVIGENSNQQADENDGGDGDIFRHLTVSGPISDQDSSIVIRQVFGKKVTSSQGVDYEISQINEKFNINIDREKFFYSNRKFFGSKEFEDLTEDDYTHLNMNKGDWISFYFEQQVQRVIASSQVPANIVSYKVPGTETTYGIEVEIDGFVSGQIEVLIAVGADDLAKAYGGVRFDAEGSISFNKYGLDASVEANVEAVAGADLLYINSEISHVIWSSDAGNIGETERSYEIDLAASDDDDFSAPFTYTSRGDTNTVSFGMQRSVGGASVDIPIPALANIVRVELNSEAAFGVKAKVNVFEINAPIQPVYTFENDTLPMEIVFPEQVRNLKILERRR